jgi:chromosome segregation ATPase
MMSLHAENLEKRRDRLDQLREDLETRHQDLLQTQIAINEAWAQMAHVTGDEGAKDRVEQAREQLADYIRNLRDGLNQQRRELDEARAQFESQKETFRGEKQQLTDWVANRESHLRRHEEQLQTQFTQIETQETAWQQSRDTWQRERLEAERIIRDLLAQLSLSNDSNISGADFSGLPETPGLLALSRFLENNAA